MTTTPDAARQARRDALLHLTRRMLSGALLPSERDLLATHVEEALRDGDQAREQLAAAQELAERTAERHGRHHHALTEALGHRTDADWDALVSQAATARATANERAAALQDARDALAAAGYPTDSNGWLILAPTISKLAAEVRLLRGNSEVDRREASKRREALATTLKRGPGADWYAIHAAAAEAVRGRETAEAEVKRLGLMVDEYSTGARQLSDKLRAAQATLTAVREIATRLAAHAVGFQDVLDATDIGPWGKTIGADLADLQAALGDPQPATETEAPALPCPHAKTETWGRRRQCFDCREWLDSATPAEYEQPTVSIIDALAADLIGAFRRAITTITKD